MPIAQGLNKRTVVKKQTALNSIASGSGGQILRRRNAVFLALRDMYESDEIVSHHQSTGARYGMKRVTGKIDGLLSPGTYPLFMAAMLEADFAVPSPLAAGTDVTATVGAPQFVDASAGLLAAGLKVGMVVRFTGFTAGGAGNNSKNFWITALTAGNMTGVFLDGSAVAAKTAGDAITITPVGKVSKAPLTSHTEDYFTIEEWQSDLSKSEVFGDLKVSQIALTLPATGNAAVSFDFVGLSRTRGDVQVLTTPAAETVTEPMAAFNGMIYVNGVATPITGLQLNIANGAASAEAEVGTNAAGDVVTGRIRVTGSFSAMFRDDAIQDLYDAETSVALCAVIAENKTATSGFNAFTLGRIRITGDAPDDGEKGIVRTYPFVAEINGSGGAALAFDQTIMMIQDSNA